MAIKFEGIKAGDVLYDVHRYKAGNVKGLTRVGCWVVRVVEVDAEKIRALVSWNGNPPQWWYRHQLEKLRRSEPKRRA